MATRKYDKRKRADTEKETRRRIIEAAMELHGTVGPLATTVSAVAERAGVERLTVYRHFPSARELFEGCGALFMERFPLPTLIPDPAPDSAADRVRATLTALHAYYRVGDAYLSVFLRDVEHIPELQALVDAYLFGEIRSARDWLVGSFDRPADPALVCAVLGQALDYWGWRSWMRQGLRDERTIEIVVRAAVHAAEAPSTAGP